MINIIDHGTGNITSVSNLLERINAQHIFTSDPESLDDASHIIIPVKNDDQNFVTSTYNFDNEYVASFEKENIYGTQFHPEKSGDVGHKLMINFLNVELLN